MQGALAGQGVGDLLHGGQHVLIVAGDGERVPGLGGLEIGLERAAVEQGQAEGRTGLTDVRTRLEQLVEVQRLHADEGGQIDVRIEGGVGLADLRGRRLGAPARGDDVRAAADQVEIDLLRRGPCAVGGLELRAPDVRGGVGRGADQGGDQVLAQVDLLVQRGQIGARGVHIGLRLIQRGAVGDAVVELLLHEAGAVLMDVDGACG